MKHAIEIDGLVRAFGRLRAVDGFELVVPAGEACALLGPNGSGKSTTLRILAGLIAAHEGAVRVLGEDPWGAAPEHLRRVAYVPESPFLPEWKSLRALISVHRNVYAGWNKDLEKRLIERLELDPSQRIGTLSKGQSRRAHLLLALCQGAELLLLDEPGSGLDVEGRREMLSLLSGWMADDERRTLLLSTHLVTDIERLASSVAVIRKGAVVAHEELDELREDIKAIELPRDVYERLRPRLEVAGVLSSEVGERRVDLVVRHFRAAAGPALREMGPGEVVVSQGAAFDHYVARDGTEVRVAHLGLEDAYLAMVGHARAEVGE